MVVMQIRHGAALALREVLRHQADAAGVLAPVVANPTGTDQHSATLILTVSGCCMAILLNIEQSRTQIRQCAYLSHVWAVWRSALQVSPPEL